MRLLSIPVVSFLIVACSSSGFNIHSTSPVGICPNICAQQAAANCKHDPFDCETICQENVGAIPPACASQLSAETSCASNATFACDANGLSYAPACTTQLATVVACAKANQGLDAGTTQPEPQPGNTVVVPDAGMTPTGGNSCTAQASDSTCSACIKQNCCPTYTACESNTSCVTVGSCVGNCNNNDTTCQGACAQQTPAGVTPFQALLACAQNVCTICNTAQ